MRKLLLILGCITSKYGYLPEIMDEIVKSVNTLHTSS